MALAYVDEQLGEALAADNVAQAIAAYQQALAIRRKVAAGQPDSADRQEDVAFDLRRLGDALAAGGDRHGALAAYRESIAIRQTLAEAEPGNIDRQMALAYVDEHLAEALAADGNHPDAIAAYRRALGLRQKIAEADPSNASRQDDVSADDEKLIKELLADGQNDEASSDARDNLAIQTKLAAAEPDSIQQQKKVASADEQLAIVLEAAGQYSDGLARRQDAFAILKSVAVRIESQETAAQGKAGRLTANELGSVAWYALFARDFEAALAAARRAADLAPDLLFVRTNLAHALMFLNRSDEAKDIYLEFRGAPLNGKTWEQVVLEDFTELRKAGLANPLMDVIEKTFAKNE
jgi:tetratricopeptide (TPR) repeat protein